MLILQSRRHFLAGLSAATIASLIGGPRSSAAEEPPETTVVRLAKIPASCFAPQYAADELLRGEGLTDVRYVALQPGGQIDAFLGHPPEPQELRARKIGREIVNTAIDPPWSQYFCCMLAGSSDYIRKYPVATKRVLRAILKAIDLCAVEPQRVAQLMVDEGFTPRFDHALQTLNEIPFGRWREYEPQDTVRFYALRLHEAGMIEASPNQIIAQGTDFSFLNELKRELKS